MEPLQIGVCSWSLALPDLASALTAIRGKLGLKLVQVGIFDESWREPDEVIDTVLTSGLEVSATCVGFAGEDYSTIPRIAATGGFVPDDLWPARREKIIAVADITQRLNVGRLMTHVGFVPHDSGSPQYTVMLNRIREVCDALSAREVVLVMETGQEKVEALLEFIARVQRQNVAVNFDPANMILYGAGEPIQAVGQLRGWISHSHMKDARWSKTPGIEWGEEVVLGTGDADIPRIVSKLRAQGYPGPLIIEREAGNNRLGDIREAIDLLESLVG